MSPGHCVCCGWSPNSRSPLAKCTHPLQYSCPENPKDRGAPRVPAHRVAKSQTRLKWPGMHRIHLDRVFTQGDTVWGNGGVERRQVSFHRERWSDAVLWVKTLVWFQEMGWKWQEEGSPKNIEKCLKMEQIGGWVEWLHTKPESDLNALQG